MQSILEERERNGEYKDIFDFVQRVNLSACNLSLIHILFFLIVRHQVQVWKEGIGSWVLKEKIILIPIIMESY